MKQCIKCGNEEKLLFNSSYCDCVEIAAKFKYNPHHKKDDPGHLFVAAGSSGGSIGAIVPGTVVNTVTTRHVGLQSLLTAIARLPPATKIRFLKPSGQSN